jgi:AraC-like DNA-binding protein
MTSPAPDFGMLRFSTEDLPAAERLPFFREVIGRSAMRLDVQALPGHLFYSDSVLRVLPGLSIFSDVHSSMRLERTRELLADGNDDMILGLRKTGECVLTQLGREVTVANGEAVLMSNADLSRITRPTAGRFLGIRLPRAALASVVRGLEDTFVRPIPRDNEALRLLAGYLDVLDGGHRLTTPELRRLVVAHVYDLAALTLGATRDAVAVALGRGVRAARLHAIKADIAEHVDSSDLSVAAVAARQRVTPRYVQMLFDTESTTFSQFVLGQRLARAHRMLSDLRYAGWTIGAIAFEVGFGDVSYFNRSFRRFYGDAPSQVRAAARQPGRDTSAALPMQRRGPASQAAAVSCA